MRSEEYNVRAKVTFTALKVNASLYKVLILVINRKNRILENRALFD
jgi:hypothetical protein